MNKFEQIVALVNEMATDTEKFYNKGNAQAGKRTRQRLQDLKVLAQEMRTEIQDIKKASK